MSEKIVQLNEEIIKGQLKELVRGSVEETLNELLEKESGCFLLFCFHPVCNCSDNNCFSRWNQKTCHSISSYIPAFLESLSCL